MSREQRERQGAPAPADEDFEDPPVVIVRAPGEMYQPAELGETHERREREEAAPADADFEDPPVEKSRSRELADIRPVAGASREESDPVLRGRLSGLTSGKARSQR